MADSSDMSSQISSIGYGCPFTRSGIAQRVSDGRLSIWSAEVDQITLDCINLLDSCMMYKVVILIETLQGSRIYANCNNSAYTGLCMHYVSTCNAETIVTYLQSGQSFGDVEQIELPQQPE